MRNGLSIPSNEDNLITQFIMREAELEVSAKTKIHCKDPIHGMYAEEHNLRIPLKLNGIFSYYETTNLTHYGMEYPANLPMIFSSPDSP